MPPIETMPKQSCPNIFSFFAANSFATFLETGTWTQMI